MLPTLYIYNSDKVAYWRPRLCCSTYYNIPYQVFYIWTHCQQSDTSGGLTTSFHRSRNWKTENWNCKSMGHTAIQWQLLDSYPDYCAEFNASATYTPLKQDFQRKLYKWHCNHDSVNLFFFFVLLKIIYNNILIII